MCTMYLKDGCTRCVSGTDVQDVLGMDLLADQIYISTRDKTLLQRSQPGPIPPGIWTDTNI